MIEAGTDVFRLNMSHAKHEWVRDIVPRVRAIAQQLEREVALLLDTQGPAIRTGLLKRDLPLAVGDILEITVRGAKSTEPNSITVNYDELIDDVSVGDTVLVEARYRGKIRATGLTMDAQVAHVWDFRDGKVVRWQQYTDTWQLAQVMGTQPRAVSS